MVLVIIYQLPKLAKPMYFYGDEETKLKLIWDVLFCELTCFCECYILFTLTKINDLLAALVKF